MPLYPASCPPRAGTPDEAGERGAGLDDFIRGKRGEVLVGEAAGIAPGLESSL
ncbi:MAG TPA: hypothetical protein VL243_10480 [Vicinamibacterales bacterium]|nr:hypothetical protein [Vicinamibacterales bacterium]